MGAVSQLCDDFIDLHSAEAAQIFDSSALEDTLSFLQDAPDASAAKILDECTPQKASEILVHFPPEKAAHWLEGLSLSRIALILRCLGQEQRSKILESFSEKNRASLKQILTYAPGTVGSLLDPFVLTLKPELTITKALRTVEKSEKLEHDQLYVTNQDYRLLGVVTLRDCMRSKPNDLISDVMKKPSLLLSPRMRLDAVKDEQFLHGSRELPVVDKNNLFLGILSQDSLNRVQGKTSTAGSDGQMLESALALGELYWVGLASILGSISGPKDLQSRSKGKSH